LRLASLCGSLRFAARFALRLASLCGSLRSLTRERG